MDNIRTPDRRECERCGRREVWDESASGWRVLTADGDRRVGDPHCIHEWDVTGSFSSVER